MGQNEEEVPSCQSSKQIEIVKIVDKILIAERMAVEITADFKVQKKVESNFDIYFDMAFDEIVYSEEERLEIMDMAKAVLKDKYSINVISEHPFMVVCESSNE